MDGSAFDRLTRSLSTRRSLLRLMTALPLGIVLTPPTAEESAAKGKSRRHHAKPRRSARTQRHNETHGEACIPTGQRCPGKKPRGKKGKRLGCNDCCQGSSTRNASGKQVCACQPNGSACSDETATRCCSGFCFAGTCQATTPCSADCNGCCDGSGTCQPGTNATACGAGGGSCTTCSGAQPVCRNGACAACTSLGQCPVNSVCDTVGGSCLSCDVCPSGCSFSSVQAAVDGRPGQHTFVICPGDYVGVVTLTRDVELIGAGDGDGPEATILRNANGVISSTVYIPEGPQNVTLRQLRITDGFTPDDVGGGVRHEGEALVMTDCTIIGNLASLGGGLSCTRLNSSTRSVDMTRCTIQENGANEGGSSQGVGGGIYNSARMTLRDCVVTNNGAQVAGGGILNDGPLELHHTTVGPLNATGGEGGGIDNGPVGTVLLDEGSVVCGNTASTAPQCGGSGYSDPSACQDTCPA